MDIKFKQIDRLVNFDDSEMTTEIRVVLEVKEKSLIKQAKEIDKEYYNKNCFGIAFNYVHNEHKLYVLGEGLYYVDNGGDDNYLEVDKEVIKRLQEKTLIEYLDYLDDKVEYSKKLKYQILEETL